MNDHISILKKDLLQIIDSLIVNKIIDSSFKKLNLSIDFMSNSRQGDVSSNLFIILKKFLIKEKYNLKENLYNFILNLSYIKDIKIANAGFINFFFKEDFLIEKLNDILIFKNKYGNNHLGKDKHVNIEFVSANPTGPIHVAHMRGAVFGDVLANVFIATGHKVTKEYYVNDSGSQITILGNSLYKRYQELNNTKSKLLEGEYPGEYLIDLAQKIKSEDGDKWLSQKINIRKDYFENFAITEILKSIKKDLSEININFDEFTHESRIIKERLIDKVFQILKKKNLLYEGILDKPKSKEIQNWEPRKQLLFKSSDYLDDKDRPFQKANGEWTYFANDAAYHYDKYLRNYTYLINIWGADHIGYINRMKSIVNVITDKKNYLEINICQIVRLIKNKKILRMSKREGNFVTLNNILQQVGKDPLRYFMVSTKNETQMDFDLDKVIEKNKDNPVFYCQYAYARASSVIKKSKNYKEFSNFFELKDRFDFNTLSKFERDIILKLISWPYLLLQSAIFKQPHKITNYIEDLSSSFHSFWNKGKDNQSLRFIDTSDVNKTITKLLWIECLRIILKKAFDIIGIQAHEHM